LTDPHLGVLVSLFLTVTLWLGVRPATCDQTVFAAPDAQGACRLAPGAPASRGDRCTAPARRPLALEDDRSSRPLTPGVTDGENAPRHLAVTDLVGLVALTSDRLERSNLEIVACSRAGGLAAPPRGPPTLV